MIRRRSREHERKNTGDLKPYPHSSTVHLQMRSIQLLPKSDDEKILYQVPSQSGHNLVLTSMGMSDIDIALVSSVGTIAMEGMWAE
jgi:hypothetical protein